MKLATALSFLVASGAVVSAFPSNQNEASLTEQVKQAAGSSSLQGAQENSVDEQNCIKPLLCCGSLTTPLDPILDPILLGLGVDAASIVGSVGLLCHPFDQECDSAPQCCSEANLLGGTLALGCAALKQ